MIKSLYSNCTSIIVIELQKNLVYFQPGNPSKFGKLKTCSSILKGKIDFIRQLQKWLGEKFDWNLCYRASRDGWSAHEFHRNCDNKGPTVVLVKVNNYIFGGYTDQNWQGMNKLISFCHRILSSSLLPQRASIAAVF